MHSSFHCAAPNLPPAGGYGSYQLKQNIKTTTRVVIKFWLDRKVVNRTFSIEDYDPNFNIAEVLEVLKDEEVEKDKPC